jgi:mono/diheme cytochrome c family protein
MMKAMQKRLSWILLILFATLLPPPPGAHGATDEADVQQLFNALGCKGCHRFAGEGGSLAPELDNIGSRMTRPQIREHLAAHAESRQHGFMPSYQTTTQAELDLLSDYLYSHKP